MARWIFEALPEEMDEEELLDELIDILAASDIDLDALDRLMAVLDKKFPLPFDIPSAEELLAEFHEKIRTPKVSKS
jgi:hypothetical protein